jgi:hypothetical protein
MLAMIIAFAAVGGFVAFAYRESDKPVVKPALRKLRLARLARIPTNKITLDEAEDGVVLSRRLGERDLERRFAKVARNLRSKRPRM